MGGSPFLQNTDFKKSFLELVFFYIHFFSLNVKYLKFPGPCHCLEVRCGKLCRLTAQVRCLLCPSLIRRRFLPVPCVLSTCWMVSPLLKSLPLTSAGITGNDAPPLMSAVSESWRVGYAGDTAVQRLHGTGKRAEILLV